MDNVLLLCCVSVFGNKSLQLTSISSAISSHWSMRQFLWKLICPLKQSHYSISLLLLLIELSSAVLNLERHDFIPSELLIGLTYFPEAQTLP